jgi:hypothetical protein
MKLLKQVQKKLYFAPDLGACLFAQYLLGLNVRGQFSLVSEGSGRPLAGDSYLETHILTMLRMTSRCLGSSLSPKGPFQLTRL